MGMSVIGSIMGGSISGWRSSGFGLEVLLQVVLDGQARFLLAPRTSHPAECSWATTTRIHLFFIDFAQFFVQVDLGGPLVALRVPRRPQPGGVSGPGGHTLKVLDTCQQGPPAAAFAAFFAERCFVLPSLTLTQERDQGGPPPPNEVTFQDSRTLEIGGERIELAWHGRTTRPTT